jgi:integrase
VQDDPGVSSHLHTAITASPADRIYLTSVPATLSEEEILMTRSGTSPSCDGRKIVAVMPHASRLGKYDGVGWHTFRHTYRSWLDDTGAPMGVQQKLMRHAQVSTTMNVYGSAYMEGKREALGKVVQMVLSGPKQKAIASTMAS